MNVVFKVAIFTMLLNLVPGILLLAMPLEAQYSSMLTPFSQQSQGQDQLISGLEGNVTLPLTIVKDILLDSLFIGKIMRLADGVRTIIWGFGEMVYNSMLLFTPDSDVDQFMAFTEGVRFLLNTLTSLVYGLGAFFLWTGRKINEN